MRRSDCPLISFALKKHVEANKWVDLQNAYSVDTTITALTSNGYMLET